MRPHPQFSSHSVGPSFLNRQSSAGLDLISAYMNTAKDTSVIDSSVSTAEMFGFELLPGEMLVIQQRQTARLGIEENVNVFWLAQIPENGVNHLVHGRASLAFRRHSRFIGL